MFHPSAFKLSLMDAGLIIQVNGKGWVIEGYVISKKDSNEYKTMKSLGQFNHKGNF